MEKTRTQIMIHSDILGVNVKLPALVLYAGDTSMSLQPSPLHRILCYRSCASSILRKTKQTWVTWWNSHHRAAARSGTTINRESGGLDSHLNNICLLDEKDRTSCQYFEVAVNKTSKSCGNISWYKINLTQIWCEVSNITSVIEQQKAERKSFILGKSNLVSQTPKNPRK